jgi:hypothetical protein
MKNNNKAICGTKLPTKNGYETFNILPVKVVNGVVSSRRENTTKESRK